MKALKKFNYKHGGATKKGALPVTRLISKEHTLYPVYFDEHGIKRSDREVKNILSILKGEKMANCKSCGAEIYFCKTKNGNPIPVNSETLTDQEKEMIDSGEDVEFKYGVHITHFATCTDAKKHTKSKK